MKVKIILFLLFRLKNISQFCNWLSAEVLLLVPEKEAELIIKKYWKTDKKKLAKYLKRYL